jgi:protein-tyrosine-phosphatase
MSLKTGLLRVWNDPVWSKVIAAGVIAAITFVFIHPLDILLTKSSLLGYVLKVVAPVILLIGLYSIIRLCSHRKTKTLVFLSSGGTCRDPMAKAILTKLLAKRKLKHPLRIEAVGLGPLSKPEVSYAARYAIREMYNEDLLSTHKPKLLTPELVRQADLILVMNRELLLTPGKTLPKDKTYVFKEFFGMDGDVEDPWPDGRDAASLARYQERAKELKNILEQNIDRLMKTLDVL